ncbi:Nuclear envelope morphology protein 1 [Phlyctochytrium bullatum]|nr:Nuclear envelope morphology protein 1 [Phlyctochytrium bullatum]
MASPETPAEPGPSVPADSVKVMDGSTTKHEKTANGTGLPDSVEPSERTPSEASAPSEATPSKLFVDPRASIIPTPDPRIPAATKPTSSLLTPPSFLRRRSPAAAASISSPETLAQAGILTAPPDPSSIATFLTWTIASFLAISSWLFPFLPIATWLRTPPSPAASTAAASSSSPSAPTPSHQLGSRRRQDVRSPIPDATESSPAFDPAETLEGAASRMVQRKPSRRGMSGGEGEDSDAGGSSSSATNTPGTGRRKSVSGKLRKRASTTSLGRKRSSAPPLPPPPASWLERARRWMAGGGDTAVPRGVGRRKVAMKTLVLDLDETLIHSTSAGSRYHDHVIEVLVEKHVCLYYVYKRPYCDLFLKKVSEWYKVVIFTASMPEYADPVIDWLDTHRTLVSRRFFRESCTLYTNGYTKNLALVEPDLSQVCLVDNSPVSYAMNKENGIPIEAWTSDTSDEALLDLLPFLDALRFCEDVRSVLSLRL